MAESLNRFLVRIISTILSQDNMRKYTFPKTLLESVAALSPQIKLEPEVMQYLGRMTKLNMKSVEDEIEEMSEVDK